MNGGCRNGRDGRVLITAPQRRRVLEPQRAAVTEASGNMLLDEPQVHVRPHEIHRSPRMGARELLPGLVSTPCSFCLRRSSVVGGIDNRSVKRTCAQHLRTVAAR